MTTLFRIISALEGLSLLALFGIAMPLKYYWGDPILVKSVGMAHGVLFIMYVLFAILIKAEQQWNAKTFVLVLVASLVPFGTFYADYKFVKK